MTLSVPAQDCITRDNVSVRVDAVVHFRVVDAVKAAVNVQNYQFAISQLAQTSLRSVIGRAELDDLLSNREKLGAELTEIIDAPSEQPWGVKVERVEVKDVTLPESMKRSMSRQAEAERERRARVISADGEFQASKKLAQAAATMSVDPAALQLRLLQTVAEVAAEKNSTLACRSRLSCCGSWSGPPTMTCTTQPGLPTPGALGRGRRVIQWKPPRRSCELTRSPPDSNSAAPAARSREPARRRHRRLLGAG